MTPLSPESLDSKCTVSIIIPTFNSGGTLARCLESIRQQTYTDYEILIQDGNSSDNTLEIVRAFTVAFPTLQVRLKQEVDNGVYDAMNKAMQRSRGEWLFFLGSDDRLHAPDVLAHVMLDPKTATADILYGNVEAVGETLGVTHGAIYDGLFDVGKLRLRNICHQAMFYRSSLANRIGMYNLDYPICADWDYNMRCWSRARFVYLNIIISYFYAGGLSTRRDDKFWSDFSSNVRRYGLLSDKSFLGKCLYVLQSQVDRVMYHFTKAQARWSEYRLVHPNVPKA